MHTYQIAMQNTTAGNWAYAVHVFIECDNKWGKRTEKVGMGTEESYELACAAAKTMQETHKNG